MSDEQHPDETEMYRSASMNAALGLSAFAAARPYIHAGASWAKDKLTEQPEPSKIELPPGTTHPKD